MSRPQILEDIDSLNISTPKKSAADISYYVSKAGSDSNNGLTSGTAFLTIAKAVSMIPQVLNHTLNIYILTGTYAEPVTIQGIVGSGNLNIYDSNGQVSVNNFSFYNNTVYTYLGGNFLITTNRVAVYRCNYTHIYGISSLFTSTTEYGIYIVASRATIQYTSVSNKSVAIYVSNCGKAIIMDVGGSGNTVALQCDFGGELVKKTGNTIVGAVQVYSSGRFQATTGSSSLVANGYKVHEDGMIEQWMTIAVGNTAANTTATGTATFPMAFPTGALNCQISCRPLTAYDFSNLAFSLLTSTSVQYSVKNGATAQQFNLHIRVLGY